MNPHLTGEESELGKLWALARAHVGSCTCGTSGSEPCNRAWACARHRTPRRNVSLAVTSPPRGWNRVFLIPFCYRRHTPSGLNRWVTCSNSPRRGGCLPASRPVHAHLLCGLPPRGCYTLQPHFECPASVGSPCGPRPESTRWVSSPDAGTALSHAQLT